jgi:hypothetical protein
VLSRRAGEYGVSAVDFYQREVERHGDAGSAAGRDQRTELRQTIEACSHFFRKAHVHHHTSTR